MNHTPGPWRIDKLHGNELFIIEPRGHWITEKVHGPNPQECEANAEFIVRACNSHDELTTALHLCADRLEWSDNPGDVRLGAAARAVLAKATS
jgi:hypothetical protein